MAWRVKAEGEDIKTTPSDEQNISFHSLPEEGLEPSTTRLRAARSAN
jgi:hypothetical protein